MSKEVYSAIEASRSEYRDKMTVRDGFTAEQQIAMTTLHNQAVGGGSEMAIMVLMPKPTIRALARKGVIDGKGQLTKYGDEVLCKWWKEAKRK